MLDKSHDHMISFSSFKADGRSDFGTSGTCGELNPQVIVRRSPASARTVGVSGSIAVDVYFDVLPITWSYWLVSHYHIVLHRLSYTVNSEVQSGTFENFHVPNACPGVITSVAVWFLDYYLAVLKLRFHYDFITIFY